MEEGIERGFESALGASTLPSVPPPALLAARFVSTPTAELFAPAEPALKDVQTAAGRRRVCQLATAFDLALALCIPEKRAHAELFLAGADPRLGEDVITEREAGFGRVLRSRMQIGECALPNSRCV